MDEKNITISEKENEKVKEKEKEKSGVDTKLIIIIILLILLFLLLGLGIGYFVGMSVVSEKQGGGNAINSSQAELSGGEIIDITNSSNGQSGTSDDANSGSDNSDGNSSDSNSGNDTSSGSGSQSNDSSTSDGNGNSGSGDNSGSDNSSGSGNNSGSGDGSNSDNSGSSNGEPGDNSSQDPSVTTPAETTSVTTPATTTTSVTTTTTTTTTNAPVITIAEWIETPCSEEFYITIDCYSRQKGVVGAPTASVLKRGTKVEVIAKTNTGYYKLKDGTFVHGDYLSKTDPASMTTTTTKSTTTTTTRKPQTTTTTKPSQGGTPACLSIEYEVFLLMNEYRVKNGLSEFKWSNDLYKVSVVRAKECTVSWSHTRPDGRNCGTALDEAGIQWTRRGENIARGQKTAQEVFNSWVDSEKHRENILNPEFNYMTVAVVTNSEGKLCWVQTFVKM